MIQNYFSLNPVKKFGICVLFFGISLEFVIWILEFLWDLIFVIWNLFEICDLEIGISSSVVPTGLDGFNLIQHSHG